MDKDGKPVVDQAGNRVEQTAQAVSEGHGLPLRAGRQRASRSSATTSAINYEVAVDSFGTLWQCDNDDDGNRGVRINYVMEYGNYGYKDEMTGAGWQRASHEDERRDPAAALAPRRSGRRPEPAA